jgi:hypothetical protein
MTEGPVLEIWRSSPQHHHHEAHVHITWDHHSPQQSDSVIFISKYIHLPQEIKIFTGEALYSSTNILCNLFF